MRSMLGLPKANVQPNAHCATQLMAFKADILHALPVVAASTGSACHSGSIWLSPVLEAMRIPPGVGMGAIRFSLGRTTTDEEIEAVVDRLKEVLA
jgi:cysteine desulfurase